MQQGEHLALYIRFVTHRRPDACYWPFALTRSSLQPHPRRQRRMRHRPSRGWLQILAETAQVSRFPTEGHFARYAGTAPIPASSGARHRHRFNRCGNRQLNAAVYRIAVTQLRIHEPARNYIARKRAEGESKTEAIHALKRLITRTVFNAMTSTIQPPGRLAAVAA